MAKKQSNPFPPTPPCRPPAPPGPPSPGDSQTLWVVGEYIDETERGAVWDIRGIFDDGAMAIAACRNERWFVGPVAMNKILPPHPDVWEGCWYPLMERG